MTRSHQGRGVSARGGRGPKEGLKEGLQTVHGGCRQVVRSHHRPRRPAALRSRVELGHEPGGPQAGVWAGCGEGSPGRGDVLGATCRTLQGLKEVDGHPGLGHRDSEPQTALWP